MKTKSHLKPSNKDDVEKILYLPMKKNNEISYRYLPAYPIKPIDDTFHGSKYLLDIEWWYFDAVFENGLSIHIGFRIYHIRGIGILQTRINIYKKGNLIEEKIKRNFLPNINVDNKKPNIIINDNIILSFNKENNSGNDVWFYNINDNIENISVQLTFTGLTQGWKIETNSTCWTVPLPSAKVQGVITINDKKINVSGKGYHDHNWGYSPTTVLQNTGWFWGRIASDTLNATWANTIESKNKQDLITVVNKEYSDNAGSTSFSSIHPNHIDFKSFDYKNNHKFTIPHRFKLVANQKNNNNHEKIHLDLIMDTINIHYDRIFIINYWRYHVLVSGTISYGNITETINKKPQIIEYLRF